MKIFKQLGLILIIWAIGEYLSSVISNVVALPGTIIGMILLFILLLTNIVKLEQIEDISNFLLDNIAFFFIPPGVALLKYMGVLQEFWLQLLIVIVVSTVIVMAVTAKVVHLMMKKSTDNE